MKEKTKKRIIYVCCWGVFVLATFLQINFSKNPIEWTLGQTQFTTQHLNGLLSGTMELCFIVLVCTNQRLGTITSYFMIVFTIFANALGMIMEKNMNAIAGITTMLVTLLAITVLRRQLLIREKDGVTDFLTGLKNRRGMTQLLEEWVERKKPFYLLSLDLDNFKSINDNRGHKFGDMVLCKVADCLREVCGENAVMSRPGGDEFIILLPFQMNVEERLKRLVDRIAEKMVIVNSGIESENYVTVSIGVVRFPEDAKNEIQLLKYGDIAMYQAKKTGKNQFYMFDRTMEQRIMRKAELEKVINESVEKKNFYMVFQPQYTASGKKLRGFETLLRLRDVDNQKTNIGELIEVAEDSDLILQIDEYVVFNALKQFEPVLKEYGNKVTLSINVSAKNICRYGFSDMVTQALNESGFPPECLEIEITEYCLAQALDIAIWNISRLKKLGIQLALDDFGTGYASLSYLSKLSIDLLKIDKSFVDAIGTGKQSDGFITAVIMIGHLNDCKVISEGVEEEEQLRFLEAEGCDYIQGYVWGRPVEFEIAKEMVAKEVGVGAAL